MLSRLKNSKYLPFLFFAVVMAVFHVTATAKFGDDIIFMTRKPLQDGLIAMNVDIYHNCSSRMFIFPTMVALSLAPICIWRVLDLCMWLMLAVSISKLFAKSDETSSNWFAVALIMLYPHWHMATAGWISTTTNFTWPLAFGLFALLTIKRLWEGVRLSAYRWALFVVAVLYSSDAEQALMILFLVFAVLAMHLVYIRGTAPLQYRNTIFCVLSFLIVRLIFTLTAPGNYVRRLAGHYTVPEFEGYSIWQIGLLSFELTIIHYVQFTLALFPLFAIFLMIIVWNQHKNPFKRGISAIPLAISTIMSANMAVDALRFASQYLDQYKGQFLDGFILMSIPSWTGSNFLFILFFASLLYTLYLSCSNNIDRCRIIGIMTLGFSSQLVLGLSSSLYGSALRTFIYACFAIIACALILYENGAKAYIGRTSKILLAMACCANFVITFIVSIVRMRL